MSKSEPKAYRNHMAGSRKGEVHREFDKKGADAAQALGLKLKLKPGTLSSWFGTWDRAKGAAKPKTKKAKRAGKTKHALAPEGGGDRSEAPSA